MTTVALETAQKNLPRLIHDVMLGEHIVITKEEEPVAELVPVVRPRPTFGSGKGVIKMSDDFDAPLEDFDEYMR